MPRNSTQSLQDILQHAVDALRHYYTGPEAERTERLREVATGFVDARQFFYTQGGDPDWLGRTYAYRRWVREVFTLANVPGDDLTTLQSAIRYHTGNILRARLDADQIEALGLKHSSPRERSVEKRERTSETLALFGAGPAITDPADVALAVELFGTFLRRVHPSALPAKDRRKVAEVLTGLAVAVTEVADEAGRRRR